MIPVRLEIEGLYSYREKQTVEFETLTAAGLFGIFGAVGSGKSSILEGILLALYGSTERLAATGERSSMLNLQSDHLLINFTFRAGKNNAQTYLSRYSAKRNKKDPEKIDTGEHVFYSFKEGRWEAIAEKAETVLGMSKEHFKQTIIIPQGKFREFIDQSPKERADMMQQLFGLERFDLSAKAGELRKAAELEKTRLKALLDNLEGISSESLGEKRQETAELEAENQKAIQALKEAEEEYRNLELTRKSFLQLEEIKTQLVHLEQKSSEIEEKRQLHKEFITAKTYLRPVWDQLQDRKKDLEKYEVSLTDCERFKEGFVKEIAQLEAEELELRKKNEERPAREAKIRDLRKVIEIQELIQKQEAAQKQVEMLQPELEAKKAELLQVELAIQQLENQSETLPSADPELLSELKSIQNQLKTNEERMKDLLRIKGNFEQEEKKIRTLLTEINQKVPAGEKSLESWTQTQKSVIFTIETEREKLLRKQGLNTHAHLLTDGEPCPLCGSLEHPLPLEGQSDEKEIKAKELEISKEKDYLEKILALIQREKVEQNNLENLGRNLQDKLKEIKIIEGQQADFWKKLKQKTIQTEEELADQISQLAQNHSKKESLIRQIQTQRKAWNLGREIAEKAEKQLQSAQIAAQDISSRIQSKQEEIKDPTFCKPFFQKEPLFIQTAIAKVERDIEEAAELLEGKRKHLQERKTAQTRNLSDIENYRRLIEENREKISLLSTEFERLKSEYGFLDEPGLIRLFHHSLDAEKTALEIRQFDQKLAITRSKMSDLQAEAGVLSFSEEVFQSKKEKLEHLREQSKTLQNQLLLLQESIKEMKQKLEEKEKLSQSFLEIESRETGLRELERLFFGKGFVKYVSSIYLRELCNTANLRFMRLTKNSLSLEIDDNNTFWVVDYLNGGKKRLLKTLSGGQTFQASLCLALALAEKVKALNQADQSFFFLDEGFGALDRNSLRVVFETLKALRHENRVVGIISHVEELQQEIGVFAQIELDAERGSQIRYSY
ncbi:SbcC/MukB-like Walker B domain-containing protein [Algoriphagus sp. oki45]|uniref:SMC family ATPase n=1 Tax=Algoriphagus sp. oki45 TaxID=3067294 RepID=UPI0027F4D4FA|nr:SbcC/MukB-like Walker B domain-containing protein [Algoriphagus sp. oki45]